MLLRELVPVLCGKVIIFEDIRGACTSPFFKNLYAGPCRDIPDKFMGCKVDYITGINEGIVDIRLGRK